MSDRKWKYGDVAMVVNYGGEEKVVRYGHGHWVFVDGSTMPEGETNARPLVVIDPEDREQVERLGELFSSRRDRFVGVLWRDAMQAALREFADPKPPRPEEPRNLGAVVEDAEGRVWLRGRRTLSFADWIDASGENDDRQWGSINAVKVLSDGIPA